MKYERIGDFKISWTLSIILNLVAGLVFISGFFLFFYLYMSYSDDHFCDRLLENSNIWISYGLVFIQVIMHEYSHAIGYKLCGGRVAYGIKWLCPYCREVSGLHYSSKGFAITLVLPLITGTVIGILAIMFFSQFLYYTITCMLVNISGAAGDITMLIYILLKAKNNYFIRDETYGFSIHKRVLA